MPRFPHALRLGVPRWRSLFARPRPYCLLLLVLSLVGSVSADEPLEDGSVRHESSDRETALRIYRERLRPVLRDKCYSCHGALKQEGNLRVDSVEGMRVGGDSGSALKGDGAGEGESEALLLTRVIESDLSLRMPIDGAPLEPEQLADLEFWLAQGAPAPEEDRPEPSPDEHWAFRLPRSAPTPTPPDRPRFDERDRSPIDAFVSRHLAERGLIAADEADRATLLRRLSLDLTGLPPTADEIMAFVADPAPDAYERQVDRLLASPAHGERWARHWMDIWRYADWHGRRMVPDVWNSAPQIWRWRDWIVRSLNEDRGYDTMVREMLAADEIAPGDPNAAVATGYLIRNWYALNPNDWMRSNVEHVSRAFLGLSMQCAHCHDHKYDPITQHDYFAFRALFETIGVRQDPWPGEEDPGPFQEYEYSTLRRVERRGLVAIWDRSPDAPTWWYSGGDERNRDASRGSIAPALPKFLVPDGGSPKRIELPSYGVVPTLHPAYRGAIERSFEERIATLHRRLESLDPQRAFEVERELADARERHAVAVAERRAAVGSAALSGERSLEVDARSGRRIIQRSLLELDRLAAGTLISFRVRLLTDRHFNMQLARDAAAGLTAGYVGFDAGRILTYRPGSFDEIEIGRYDHTAGEQEFLVRWSLEPDDDRAQLDVTDPTGTRSFASAKAAINGWNPIGDPNRPITFDIRNGQHVLLDDLVVACPETIDSSDGLPAQITDRVVLKVDFEPATGLASDDGRFEEGDELFGAPHWLGSFLDEGTASAIVTSVLLDENLHRSAGEVRRLAGRRKLVDLERPGIEAELRRTLADRERQLRRHEAEALRADGSGSSTDEAIARVEQRAIDAERDYRTAVQETEGTIAAFEMAEATASEGPDSAARQVAARRRLDAALAATATSESAESISTYESLPPFGRSYATFSTGRRTMLADWIVSPSNPLAARVAVNHVWGRHFGRPLVTSVDDFGRNGAPPSHPELLDRLAVDLVAEHWSLERLSRRIVLSSVYRRDSRVSQALRSQSERDPEAVSLWRRVPGRMEAELIRDAILAGSDRLDRRFGGEELENERSFDLTRRSLYFSCQPEIDGRSEFAALFDAPDPLQCYRRTRSLMPQQALALTNSRLIDESSMAAATAISERAHGDPDRFVDLAWLELLGRPANTDEREACLTFLHATGDGGTIDVASESSKEAAASRRAALVRVLWNHHEFLTIR